MDMNEFYSCKQATQRSDAIQWIPVKPENQRNLKINAAWDLLNQLNQLRPAKPVEPEKPVVFDRSAARTVCSTSCWRKQNYQIQGTTDENPAIFVGAAALSILTSLGLVALLVRRAGSIIYKQPGLSETRIPDVTLFNITKIIGRLDTTEKEYWMKKKIEQKIYSELKNVGQPVCTGGGAAYFCRNKNERKEKIRMNNYL